MSPDRNIITILLADDHPTTRAGIRAILQEASDIKVVGEADNGNDTMRLVAELSPQILLLDLQMPGPSPAELEKWVRKNYPNTITLVLTAHDRDAYLASMIDAGAVGFLSKTERAEQLIAAIRRAAGGEILFESKQLARAQRWREEVGSKWQKLTNREREILQLLAGGLDNMTIAEKLKVSPKTIAFHVTNVLGKLDVKSRHEAIAWLHKYFPENLE
jgi:two-component system, NarL family, response regulator LiaR